MRRIHFFNLIVFASGWLALVSVVEWLDSYQWSEHASLTVWRTSDTATEHVFKVRTSLGRVAFQHVRTEYVPAIHLVWLKGSASGHSFNWTTVYPDDPFFWNARTQLGFGMMPEPSGVTVFCPFWVPLIVTMILPLWWARRRWKRGDAFGFEESDISRGR